MQWDVFWVRGGRIGSFPRGSEESNTIRRDFPVSLIQKDANGSRHYSITGSHRARGQKREE